MKQKKVNNGSWKVILKYQKRHWKLSLLAFFLLLFSSLLQLPAPLITRYLIDDVLGSKDYFKLNSVALILLFVLLFYRLSSYLFQRVVIENRIRVEGELRKDLWERLIFGPSAKFDLEHKGYLQSRLDSDVVVVGNLFLTNILDIGLNIATLIVGIFLMFYLNLTLAIVSLLCLPLFVYISRKFSFRLQLLSGERQEVWARFRGILVEFLQMFLILKVYSSEKKSLESYEEHLNKALSKDKELGLLSTLATTLSGFLTGLLPLFVLWYGLFLIMKDHFTIGSFLAFYSALSYVYGPIGSLVNISFDVNTSLAAANRITEILETPKEEYCFGKKELKEVKAIDVVDLIVSPSEGKETCPINFSLKKGEWLGIVGETGCGKTSLLKTIVGLISAKKGRVLLNGDDLYCYSLSTIRKKIALVPQEAVLFRGTFKENLLFFKGDLTEDKLNELLKYCLLENVFQKFKNGWNEDIAESGATLSGGEKARISLLRALVVEPEVLLLDETTSQLDMTTEKELLVKLKSFPSKQTVIIVSHRPSVLEFTDKVLEVKSFGVNS